MSITPGFIDQILSERQASSPDRVRFISNTAAYLFSTELGSERKAHIDEGLSSARACCQDLRDQVREALDDSGVRSVS